MNRAPIGPERFIVITEGPDNTVHCAEFARCADAFHAAERFLRKHSSQVGAEIWLDRRICIFNSMDSMPPTKYLGPLTVGTYSSEWPDNRPPVFTLISAAPA